MSAPKRTLNLLDLPQTLRIARYRCTVSTMHYTLSPTDLLQLGPVGNDKLWITEQNLRFVESSPQLIDFIVVVTCGRAIVGRRNVDDGNVRPRLGHIFRQTQLGQNGDGRQAIGVEPPVGHRLSRRWIRLSTA